MMIRSTYSGPAAATGSVRAGAVTIIVIGIMTLAASPVTAEQKIIPEMKKMGYVPEKILEGACARSGGAFYSDANDYGCATDDSAVACHKADKSCAGCDDGCKSDGKQQNSKRMQMQLGLFRSGRTAPLAGGLLEGNNGLGTQGPAPTGAIAPNNATGTPTPAPTVK